MSKSVKSRRLGPPAPFMTPPAVEGEGCEIIFGHNAEIRKVLMQFSVAATRLIFSPEDARDCAKKLQFYADMAEGKKAM